MVIVNKSKYIFVLYYVLNIIKGDSKGNFNENQCISNAKAALYIYNMVSLGDIRY